MGRSVSSVRAGAALLGLAAALTLTRSAPAQQLWSVEEVMTRPLPTIETGGGVASAATVGIAGPATAEAATVQVEFDYLRLGMGYLELPLWNGSVIAAENAVFEDRGGGNFLWTGEVPGAGYESVLFTVQDGYLAGWFGAPGGPKYVVYAEPDGSGTLTVETGPTGDWCGAEAARETATGEALAAAGDRSAPAVPASNDGRLDILVLYPAGTERYWRTIGGPAVGLQQLADYVNMAFRNGEIPATANLIPARWEPLFYSHPETQGWHHLDRSDIADQWHWEFAASAEVDRLRKRYEPDLIHFIPSVGGPRNTGQGDLRSNSGDPAVLTGWSIPMGSVFAHEIGHNLGGHHEPVTFGGRFREEQLSEDGWPYRFGHTDLTSCSRREGYGHLSMCPATLMSYGQDLWGDPGRQAVHEPLFSSVRHKPNGWTIGVAGTSEAERVFHETIPVAVVSGVEAPHSAEQYPRRVTGARWTGRDTVRVTWSGDWRSRRRGRVRLALAEGGNDIYRWAWDSGSDPPVLHAEYSDDNVKPILTSDGSQVGVDISGLRPGGRYRIAARGPSRLDHDTQTATTALQSDAYLLEDRGRVSGSPAAPSELGARETGPDSVRLHWRDNSRVETGYEVWYRKWSGDEPDRVWRRYAEPLPEDTRHVHVEGLAAEEEIRVTGGYRDLKERVWVEGEGASRGRYSFVVVAYNDKGWNASETFDLEFMPGPHPEQTASGEVTDCSTWNRPTGVNLDGYRVHACVETPDGARRRAWDYGLESDRSALLYFFDRDDAEILVKVLDGCGVNGHRWVFIAPITDLPFKLTIRETGPHLENRRQQWQYDSTRRPQTWFGDPGFGNPKGRTARTVSDTTAFRCTAAEVAAAADAGFGVADLAEPSSPTRLVAGARTDCQPGGPSLTLRGGYTVSMCYETYEGRAGGARDWGLDSSRSGLLYFFDRNNVEVLIKVLDGCGVNGHRWVFVAPVTDLAFNLHVESPTGERWTHTNRLGQTADTATDTSAFPCAPSA